MVQSIRYDVPTRKRRLFYFNNRVVIARHVRRLCARHRWTLYLRHICVGLPSAFTKDKKRKWKISDPFVCRRVVRYDANTVLAVHDGNQYPMRLTAFCNMSTTAVCSFLEVARVRMT